MKGLISSHPTKIFESLKCGAWVWRKNAEGPNMPSGLSQLSVRMRTRLINMKQLEDT